MEARRSNLLAATAAALAVAGGGWLTVRGVQAIPAGASPIGDHLPLLGILFGALLLIALLPIVLRAGRGMRLGVLPATAGAMLLLAAACGQLAAFATVVALFLSACCAGRLLLPRRLEADGFESLLLGLAVFGTIVGATAHLPIHYRGTATGLLLLPLLLGWRHAGRTVQAAWAWAGERQRAPVATALLHAAIGAVALLLFAVAMMPERGHDALAMHLLVPEYVRWHQHWPFDVEHYVWAVMPMLGDWLYTLAVLLDGEVAARLCNFAALLLLARTVHALSRWAGAGPRSALLAVLVLVSTPLTMCEISSLFVDSIWSSLLLGGTLAALRLATAEGSPNKNLLLAGALLGGAMAAKAVTFMALPVLALVFVAAFRRWLRADAIGGLLTGGALFAGIGCLPYLRAWLYTGNPVFPFFNGIFRSEHYPHENFEAPVVFDKGMTWDVLYRITFDASRFLEGMPGAGGFQWLLAVAPALLVFALTRHWRGVTLLVLCGAIAFLTFRQTAYLRYVLPSFAMAAAAVGALAARPTGLPSAVGWIGALAAVGLNLTFYASATFHGQLEWRVLADEAERHAFVTHHLPMRHVVQTLNGINPEGNDVAFFAAPMVAGLHAEGLFPNWYNHRFDAAVAAAADADAFGALLGARHVRYVVLADTWQDEARRSLLRGATRSVRRIEHLDVRELLPRHRAPTELLAAPRFDQPTRWYAPADVTFGEGLATLAEGAICNQTVEITPEREHLLSVDVDAATTDGEGQLMLVWADRRGRFVHQLVTPLRQRTGRVTVEVVAPRRARQAILSATCRAGTVAIREISLRH
ncbi:MAG: hypothetical protein ACE37K_21305 [Planctomycetota bacterium]